MNGSHEVVVSAAAPLETECANCGMEDVPLIHDECCAGCVCAHCGRSAFEAGRSMNDMGWCDACEDALRSDLR